MIEHDTLVRVGYRDTDKMGVVHHSVYPVYFEIGRTELLRSLGLVYAVMEQSGVMLPLLEYSVRMMRPARYDDRLLISARLTPPQGVRLQLDYNVTRDGELLVVGTTLHAFTTVDTMRPVRPPKGFLEVVGSGG